MKLLFLSIASFLVEAQNKVALVASFGPYPEYSGNLNIVGSIDISSTAGSAYSFDVSLIGGEQAAKHTFHIHAGVTCAAATAVGGHFWAPFNATDPWNTPSLNSDSSGAIIGTFTVDFGYTADSFIGHAMVVHSSNGVRTACGIIGGGNNKNNLVYPTYETTVLGKYPGYLGALNATGTIEVRDLDSTNQVVNFRLVGLEPNATGGVHIHAGKTCATSGDHFWTPLTDVDPWLVTTYLANSAGQADGSFIVDSGYLLADNIHHAMVVHDANKTRIACGTLGGTLVGVVSEFTPYPGYTGTLSVSGRVAISYEPSRNDSKYRFAVKLANGEQLADMAFHIHAGVSCANAASVGGHFWAPFPEIDPWNFPKIRSTSMGTVDSLFDLAFGYTHEEFVGHAVVIHNSSGARVACGLIGDANATLPIYQKAELGLYPNYNGTLNVTGVIEVRDLDATRQVVNFRLAGLAKNVSGGVHIHVGTTCAESGDHFWTPVASPDPWLDRMYTSNGAGLAEGSFIVSSGYLLAQNIHHAVVVHDADKTRAACGLLGGASLAPSSAPSADSTSAPSSATTSAPSSATTSAPSSAGSTSAPSSATTSAPSSAGSTSAPSSAGSTSAPSSAGSTSAPSPAGNTNNTCPQAAIEGVFNGCKAYDFSGTAACSSVCSSRLTTMVTAFKAQNASVVSANECLDLVNSTKPWVNGALATLKQRMNVNGVALCNATTESISGAVAISSFIAVAFTPLFLWV